MFDIYTSADSLIGNTPLLELTHIEKQLNLKARILAKLEFFNPAGSVKDRVAKAMIDNAEKKGVLKKGSVIIEPTSGNTGIGLAFMGAVRGYRVIVVMPENMSPERIQIMKAYGAEVVLSDASRGMSGCLEVAQELSKKYKNSFIPGQFVNPSNPEIHRLTTAVEIFDATDGKLDAFVAGVGTGGTLTGVSEYLKEKNSTITCVAVEPAESAVLSGKEASSHLIQGIGAGFVPEILNTAIYDEVIAVSNDDAFNTVRLIAKSEGILVGISSGAAAFAAIELAKRDAYNGKTIVTVFPDSGERYFSTSVFDDACY